MMIAFSCVIEKFTSRLYGIGPRVKEADLATEIKVMTICGSSLDRQPDLSCLCVNNSTMQEGYTKRVNFQVCI